MVLPIGRELRAPQRVRDRFWSSVDVTDWHACWPHRRVNPSHGYAIVSWTEAGTLDWAYAHRLAWTIIHGPIPETLTLDHRCRTRPCCNPLHLRVMTLSDNSRRWNVEKTHCPQGHAYAGDNLYVLPGKGWRYCRTCKNAGERRRRREGASS